MGPNGAGKSTLGNVLIGHPNYEITGGSIKLDGVEQDGILCQNGNRWGYRENYQA